MPAEFENGVFGGNKAAWHGLGTVVEDDVLTAAEVIENVPQLGMHVELTPLYAFTAQGEKIDTGSYATIREDGQVLGHGLTKSYQVVQNFEAFDWVDNLMGDSDVRTAKYHTAGTLKGGQVAWLLAKFSEGIKVGGLDEELVDFYFLCGNYFHGHGSLFGKVVKERVVCSNTFDIARGEGGSEIKIWHTSSAADKMAQASKVLDIVAAERQAVQEVGTALIGKKLSDAQFRSFLQRLVPYPAGANLDKDRSARNKQEARDAIAGLYRNSPNLQNVKGTAWAAYNAVTEYFDHTVAANTRGGDDKAAEARFTRILNDTKLKDRALEMLVRA
jgi:phage/plasmid-like protein (TIGR03299 family)